MILDNIKKWNEENLVVKGLIGRDEPNLTAGRLLTRLWEGSERMIENSRGYQVENLKNFEKLEQKTEHIKVNSQRVPSVIQRLDALTLKLEAMESDHEVQ